MPAQRHHVPPAERHHLPPAERAESRDSDLRVEHATEGAENDAVERAAQRIVLRAMSRDAGLDEQLARGFVDLVLAEVHGGVPADDAPELARRLLAAAPHAGASAASVVAAAAAEVLAGDEA